MTQLLVFQDQVQDELAVIQAVLQGQLKADLEADPFDSIMSEGLIKAVNIALRRCLGKRKLPDDIRYRILAEVSGRPSEGFVSSSMMGKRVALAFIDWVYGPNADLSSNPPPREGAVMVLQHLYDAMAEVAVG